MKTYLDIYKGIRIVNPYTFVSGANQSTKIKRMDVEENYREKTLHTGLLHCRLSVKTPLAVLDTALVEKAQNGHRQYPFFTYEEGDEKIPMIPGSTIRGTIRSVFEAATDSCMSTMRDNTGLSKRVESDKAYSPGILKWEEGKWNLYKAKRYVLAACGNQYHQYSGLEKESYISVETRLQEGSDTRTYRVIKNGEHEYRFGDLIDFTIYPEHNRYVKTFHIHQDSEGNGLSGYVYAGEPFQNKRGESVFVCQKQMNVDTEVLNEAYDRLLKTLEIYRNDVINKSEGHTGYGDFEKAERQGIIPLWYQTRSEKEVYLSLGAIGRTFYRSSLNKLVGESSPCKDRKHLCEACALFGMTGTENLGSRIRFTDAKVVGNYSNSGKVKNMSTLQILGEPRYSYLPFYATTKDGTIPDSYDYDSVEIMGRKFYWHNMEAKTSSTVYQSGVKNEMNSTVELMSPGTEFEFQVYYDGITEEQLKKLIWCICIGENQNRSDAKMYHKMGHGKPLGLGSVKMIVEKREEREFKNCEYIWKESGREDIAKYIEGNLNFPNQKVLLKVLNKYEPGKSQPGKALAIEYPDIRKADGSKYEEPREKNDTARHLWYAKNKEKNNKYRQALPGVMENDQGLYTYVPASEYQAVVIGYNAKKTSVYIQLKDGQRGSVWYQDIRGAKRGQVDKCYKKGQKVQVVLKESDDDRYKNYIIIK